MAKKNKNEFEKALAAFSASKTKSEFSKRWKKMLSVMPDVEHDRFWDKAFRAAGKFVDRWPDTAKEKKEMEDLFNSLPEYVPLPTKPGETLAIFIGKKK